MKKIAFVVSIVGMSMGLSGLAQASTTAVAADQSASTKICMAAIQGNKIRFDQAIKNSGLTKRYVVNELKCNGLPVSEFAEKFQSPLANKADKFIAQDNTYATKICMAAASGNKHQFNRAVADTGVSKLYVLKTLTCNGMSVEQFVEKHTDA